MITYGCMVCSSFFHKLTVFLGDLQSAHGPNYLNPSLWIAYGGMMCSAFFKTQISFLGGP